MVSSVEEVPVLVVSPQVLFMEMYQSLNISTMALGWLADVTARGPDLWGLSWCFSGSVAPAASVHDPTT